MSTKIKLAVVAFDSLGDGLIHAMVAENFSRNDFEVTYFGDLISSFSHWLPSFEALPYPSKDSFEEVLDSYDAVFISPPRFIRNLPQEEIERLSKKYVFFCQKAKDFWRRDLSSYFKQKLSEEKYKLLKNLPLASGAIRYKSFGEDSVVHATLEYLKLKVGLEGVSKTVTLDSPSSLKHRQFNKRIIISPDSAGPSLKEWTPSLFLELADKLQVLGFEVHIVVAPNNYDEWQNRVNGKYPVPKFDNFCDWVNFLYESALIIANDSGNGHLASFLGIPTITIYRKRNLKYYWRPSWSSGIVVYPGFMSRFSKKEKWRKFIPVQKIVEHVEALVNE